MRLHLARNVCQAVVNGRRWTMQRGDLLVMRGGDEFTLSHDPARPHVSLSASLACEQGGLVNTLLYRKFQRRYVWHDPDAYIAEFEKVLAALQRTSPCRELGISGALLQWLAYMLERLRPPLHDSLAEERGVVDRILLTEAWANSRLPEVITLPAWARAAGLAPTYFGRVFKRETGLRPMDWLNQRRLQTACQLLGDTSMTVSGVAEACDFASPFYFSRVFRRHFGQSPLHYRRTQGDANEAAVH